MTKEKSAAIITIKHADAMTKKGRRDVAEWLRMHANYLLEHGKEYAPRFTARYLYR